MVLKAVATPNASSITNGTLATSSGGTGATSLSTSIVRRLNSYGAGQIVSQCDLNAGTGLSNGTDTQRTYRIPFYFPQYTYDLKVVFPNYGISTALVQAGPGNAITVNAALEVGSTYIPMTFSGSSAVVINNNSEVISDVIPYDLPAATTAYVRVTVTVSSGQKWPLNAQGTTTWSYGNNAVDSANGTGALANSGSGSNCYNPVAILGATYPKTSAAIGLFGDSIMAGSGDVTPQNSTYTSQNYGFGVRGVGGYSATPTLNYAQLAVAGSTLAESLVYSNAPALQRHVSSLEYAITEWGSNDINNQTLATLQANLLLHWNRFASRGIPVYQTTYFPRTTSTDKFVTTTNQTPVTTTISGATNASPIQITTSSNHYLTTGQTTTISGVTGNTAANGTFVVTVTGATTFTLNGSTGNGSYVSGGGVQVYETNRLALNAWIRTVPAPLSGYIETANTVEANSSNVLTQNGGRWWVQQTSPAVSGTASGAGGTTYLNDTTKSWTTNQWIGYIIIITGGTGAGSVGTISANTATQIISYNLGVATDATSTYIIQQLPTIDGTHPAPTGHQLAAVPVASLVSTFTGL